MPLSKFIGGYEHSIDPKGRLILPSKFRPHFADGGVLSEYFGCIALWTEDQFVKQLEKYEAEDALGGDKRGMARLWAQSCMEVEVDRQGRFVIPSRLREFAGLDGQVLVNGMINRIEIWAPEKWETKIREPHEPAYQEGE